MTLAADTPPPPPAQLTEVERAHATIAGLEKKIERLQRQFDTLLEALRTGERYVFAGIPEGAFDLETVQRRRFDELMAAIEAGIVPKA